MATLILLSSVVGGAVPQPGNGISPIAPAKTLNWAYVGTSVHPRALFDAMMAYDAADGYVVLFGGVTNSSSLSATNATWSYHAGNWTLLSTPVAPHPRYLGAMTYDATDGYVLLFGGAYRAGGNTVVLNDTWKFSGGVWAQLHPAKSPPGRESSQYTYDARMGAVIVGGGFNPSHGNETDMWKFHAGAWSRIVPGSSIVPFNGGGSLGYDAFDQVLVYLHTGCWHCGTYEYRAGNWHTLAYTSAEPGGGLTTWIYDPAVKMTLYVNASNYFAGFANGTWSTFHTTTGVTLGSPPITAFDASDHYLLLFSGGASTWRLA